MKNKSRKIISALVLCVALAALSVTAYAASPYDTSDEESIGDDEVIIGGTDVPTGIMTAE